MSRMYDPDFLREVAARTIVRSLAELIGKPESFFLNIEELIRTRDIALLRDEWFVLTVALRVDEKASEVVRTPEYWIVDGDQKEWLEAVVEKTTNVAATSIPFAELFDTAQMQFQ